MCGTIEIRSDRLASFDHSFSLIEKLVCILWCHQLDIIIPGEAVEGVFRAACPLLPFDLSGDDY